MTARRAPPALALAQFSVLVLSFSFVLYRPWVRASVHAPPDSVLCLYSPILCCILLLCPVPILCNHGSRDDPSYDTRVCVFFIVVMDLDV